MSRAIHKLKAVAVSRLSKPGLYGDGGGLYLQITTAGVKSWHGFRSFTYNPTGQGTNQST
jgi:hypothetical protein